MNLNSLLSPRIDRTGPEFSYKLGNTDTYGLDVAIAEDLGVDEGKMSAWVPFASGERRDGVGDMLEVGGIRLERHRANPVVGFDHFKDVKLPIGLAEDPITKTYSVVIDPLTKQAKANCFFYQGTGLSATDRDSEYDHAVFCEQIFDLWAKRFIRAGSIGYQVVKAVQLPPDYEKGTPQGLHLIITLMLECSCVVMPANQDTVRKTLSLPSVCGKPLSPMLVKSLTPYASPRKAQMGYERKATSRRRYESTPAYRDADETPDTAKVFEEVVSDVYGTDPVHNQENLHRLRHGPTPQDGPRPIIQTPEELAEDHSQEKSVGPNRVSANSRVREITSIEDTPEFLGRGEYLSTPEGLRVRGERAQMQADLRARQRDSQLDQPGSARDRRTPVDTLHGGAPRGTASNEGYTGRGSRAGTVAEQQSRREGKGMDLYARLKSIRAKYSGQRGMKSSGHQGEPSTYIDPYGAELADDENEIVAITDGIEVIGGPDGEKLDREIAGTPYPPQPVSEPTESRKRGYGNKAAGPNQPREPRRYRSTVRDPNRRIPGGGPPHPDSTGAGQYYDYTEDQFVPVEGRETEFTPPQNSQPGQRGRFWPAPEQPHDPQRLPREMVRRGSSRPLRVNRNTRGVTASDYGRSPEEMSKPKPGKGGRYTRYIKEPVEGPHHDYEQQTQREVKFPPKGLKVIRAKYATKGAGPNQPPPARVRFVPREGSRIPTNLVNAMPPEIREVLGGYESEDVARHIPSYRRDGMMVGGHRTGPLNKQPVTGWHQVDADQMDHMEENQSGRTRRIVPKPPRPALPITSDEHRTSTETKAQIDPRSRQGVPSRTLGRGEGPSNSVRQGYETGRTIPPDPNARRPSKYSKPRPELVVPEGGYSLHDLHTERFGDIEKIRGTTASGKPYGGYHKVPRNQNAPTRRTLTTGASEPPRTSGRRQIEPVTGEHKAIADRKPIEGIPRSPYTDDLGDYPVDRRKVDRDSGTPYTSYYGDYGSDQSGKPTGRRTQEGEGRGPQSAGYGIQVRETGVDHYGRRSDQNEAEYRRRIAEAGEEGYQVAEAERGRHNRVPQGERHTQSGGRDYHVNHPTALDRGTPTRPPEHKSVPDDVTPGRPARPRRDADHGHYSDLPEAMPPEDMEDVPEKEVREGQAILHIKGRSEHSRHGPLREGVINDPNMSMPRGNRAVTSIPPGGHAEEEPDMPRASVQTGSGVYTRINARPEQGSRLHDKKTYPREARRSGPEPPPSPYYDVIEWDQLVEEPAPPPYEPDTHEEDPLDVSHDSGSQQPYQDHSTNRSDLGKVSQKGAGPNQPRPARQRWIPDVADVSPDSLNQLSPQESAIGQMVSEDRDVPPVGGSGLIRRRAQGRQVEPPLSRREVVSGGHGPRAEMEREREAGRRLATGQRAHGPYTSDQNRRANRQGGVRTRSIKTEGSQPSHQQDTRNEPKSLPRVKSLFDLFLSQQDQISSLQKGIDTILEKLP